MAIIKTSYNRRSFLKASAMAGGGMALGFSWLVSCKPTPEQVLQMPEEWFDINGFLKIGENGLVTILSPNPEIGQNVKTSMPMIVAEELDINWDHVIVEQAPLNTEVFSRQVAGGSQSIRRSWDGLRMAGATARRMLLEAAAKQLEVPVAELTTDQGIIKHADSGQELGYGDVATEAASMEVPEEIELKDPKDFKIIGTSRKNVDGKKIATGKPLFGWDVSKENMLTAMLVHPPAFGMKIKSLNKESVTSMPGIVDVFQIDLTPEGVEKQWSDVNAFNQLVAIVGKSTWEVMKAKKAINVEWETDTPLENTEDHYRKMEEQLANGADEKARQDGDPESVFRTADQIIESTYSAPFWAHNTMAPMNFYADVRSDRAELEGPIQTPEYLRKSVSALLDMPEENISIMMTRMGGGFGRRLYGNFGSEAALISKQAGAPIKLVYSREDDMSHGIYKPAYKVKYKAALDKEKNVIAWSVSGTGIGGGPVFSNRFPAGTVDHYSAENQGVESNISVGAWRAPRSNFIGYAEQAFLDEVAEAAGKDPIDLRIELFERAINSPVGENNDYDPERYAGVLKLVKEKSNWGSDMPGVHRGVSAYYCHNSYVAQVVDVIMENGQPRVKKVTCAVDCGIVINPDAARNQIEGGIVDGIGHALYGNLTIRNGRPEQQNFDAYQIIRQKDAPLEVETHFVDNGIDPTGLGEPSLPPVQGALANALYKATGSRLYDQPFVKSNDILG